MKTRRLLLKTIVAALCAAAFAALAAYIWSSPHRTAIEGHITDAITSTTKDGAYRLFDAISGIRFAGVAVDLQGAVASGQFAIIGPVALFRGGNGGATGLVVPQSGSTKPLIRPLEGPLQAGLAALVESGTGLLPLCTNPVTPLVDFTSL